MLIGIGMGIGGRGGGAAGSPGTLEFVAAGGAAATTTAPSGSLTGCCMICFALKPSITAPTHDTAGGALIGTWSGLGSSGNAFWKYAEDDTPDFGTHTGAGRVLWQAWRFSNPPVNPIGAFARAAANASLIMGWTGLTLQKQSPQVITVGYRAADEAINLRSDVVSASGGGGVSARYTSSRSNGAVSAWAAQDVAQAVSGVHQSIAIEIGY